MSNTTIVLVTGANTGLGLAIVRALQRSSRTYTILLGGRSLEKADAAAGEVRSLSSPGKSTVTTVQIDIEDDASIEALAKLVEKDYGRLDVLINNAGGQYDQQYQQGNMGLRQMWDKTLVVDTTSPHIITHALAPLLIKSADPRLLFVTSGVSTMGEHDEEKFRVNKSPAKGWPKENLALPAYRAAKAALNMLMLEWARILKEDGVKVWCVSPGLLATGLGGSPEALKQLGAIDPAIGGDVVLGVVEGKRDADVGKVVRRNDIQPW